MSVGVTSPEVDLNLTELFPGTLSPTLNDLIAPRVRPTFQLLCFLTENVAFIFCRKLARLATVSRFLSLEIGKKVSTFLLPMEGIIWSCCQLNSRFNIYNSAKLGFSSARTRKEALAPQKLNLAGL